MTTSSAGLAFIRWYEQFRSRVYLDAAGLQTIGYGHRVKPRESFKQPITLEQAEQLFEADVRVAEDVVNAWVKCVLTQHEFDALVSFVFNVGAQNFLGSTMLRLLKIGQRIKAALEFVRWDHCDGRVVEGLLLRRQDEEAMFSRGEYRHS